MATPVQLLVALLCALACGASHADRSRLDDENVARRGDCEVELAMERQTVRQAEGHSVAPHAEVVQLSCGVGARTEIVAAYTRERSDGERALAVDLEARSTLFDLGRAGGAWSLSYGASAERSAGTSWRTVAHFVALDAAWRPAEAWVLEARLGWSRDRIEARHTRAWLLAVEHEISDRLEVRAEVADDPHSRPLVGVELRCEFWPDVARLQLSWAARSGASRERRLGVGLAFEF